MIIDLFHDGQFVMSATIDFGVDDIVVCQKSIISLASVGPEGFDELFFRAYKYSKTHKESYENAQKIHCANFGHNKYSSYEAFAVSKTRHRKLMQKK